MIAVLRAQLRPGGGFDVLNHAIHSSDDIITVPSLDGYQRVEAEVYVAAAHQRATVFLTSAKDGWVRMEDIDALLASAV